MAANDSHQRTNSRAPGGEDWLLADAVIGRIEEEIKRSERHGTGLSCLLVVIDNLTELTREHGEELREQTLEYVAGVLRGELRGFDRIGRPSDQELLIVLPGADGPRGEMVARRVLDRLRAIKVEARGARRPLRVSVGLAAWRDGLAAGELLARTRAAALAEAGEDPPGSSGQPQQDERSDAQFPLPRGVEG
jgi:diguanylate cyclase (GGDEF)-like protein